MGREGAEQVLKNIAPLSAELAGCPFADMHLAGKLAHTLRIAIAKTKALRNSAPKRNALSVKLAGNRD